MRSSKKLILCGCLAAAFTGTAMAQPANIAVAPSSGTGTVQSFAFQASSPNGAADLSQITAMFNYAIDGYGSCFVVAYPALNSISLMDDAGNWAAFQTLGSPGNLQNSQCTLNLAASSIQTSLNTVTLNLALTFKPPWRPARANVLASMALGGTPAGGPSFYVGSVGFSKLRLDFAAVTQADPATSVSTGSGVQAAFANIVLQSSRLSDNYYADQTTQDLALTLIHELGHVFNIVSGLGGSAIIGDANPDGSANQDAEDANEKTPQKCHPK
jgi:hypothetical protein